MRLFVAMAIDDETRAQLRRTREALQSIIESSRVPPRVTWVNEQAAHVTIRFIGETTEDTLLVIQRALAAVTFAPFELTWGTISVFGGTRSPRVIWIAPVNGTSACMTLAAQVNARLDPVLGAGEARAFTPHLTLGRVRDAGRQVKWAHAIARVSWTPTVTRVTQVVLYQSRLSPKGPTYTALSSHG